MDIFSATHVYILLQFCAVAVLSCTFPQEWHGQWYKAGTKVQITRTQMTPKGSCHTKEGDKYIVKKLGSNGDVCYTCLAIYRRHENILQYKASHCTADSSRACASIEGDAPLYTLVRESNPKIIPCPFEGPFSFIYDNASRFCSEPKSSISVCANPAHLKFHFKECPIVGTVEQNLQLTCLATWRNGGEFVYVKLSGPGYTTKKLRYRCMTYDSTNNRLAMSADPQCDGLTEFNTVPLQIEMTKERPAPETLPTRFSFPAWLTSTTWRDLRGHTIYDPLPGGKTLHIKQGPGRHGHVHETTLRCRKMLRNTTSLWEGISYTTHGCSSNFQCVRVSKMAPDGSVLEIQLGRYVPHESDACLNVNMVNTSTYTIIANSSNIIPCPFRGYYSIESSERCDDVINPRCDDTAQIVIDSCNEEEGNLQCIASWSDNDKEHIIATSPISDQANCFTLSSKGGRYRLDLDAHCNNGVNPILKSAYPSYMLKKVSGTCLMKEKEQSPSSSSSASSSNNDTNVNTDTTSLAPSIMPVRHSHVLALLLAALLVVC